MSTHSRKRFFLLLLFLPLAFAFAWGVHSYLVRQAAANTRRLIGEVLSSDNVAAFSLLNKGANPNAVARNFTQDPDNIARPLLIHAVQSGNEKIVKALLDHGANPNVRDSSGTTPLSDAVMWNRMAIISDLLVHGADVNARDSNGETALFSAIAGSDACAVTVSALIAHGADVNVQENGFRQTALMRAVNDTPSSEQSGIVQAILALIRALS